MYRIDLAALTECSTAVTMTSFDTISPRAITVFMNWLEATIGQVGLGTPGATDTRSINVAGSRTPGWETHLRNALNPVWATDILMPEGPMAFTRRVADFVLENHQGRPIFPVINDNWKSDAWLTGLMLQQMDLADLGSGGLGFALTAKPIPEKPHKGLPTPKSFDLLYLDDASYSGTQMFNLLGSILTSGLVPQRIFLMLAGCSQAASDRLRAAPLWGQGSQPMVSMEIMQQMRQWNPPHGIVQLLRHFYGPMRHIEVEPGTLQPQPTTGEFPIFDRPCLAILPYKIPDSVSVPTHLYIAYNPESNPPGSIFENEGGHIFTGNGRVTYREVMREGASTYATKL